MPRLLLTAALLSCATTAGPVAGLAGDFQLRDVEGHEIRLSDYAGRVVLVDFWATWCDPCMAELPHLNELAHAYRDRGLVVLAVSMDAPETIAQVAPVARRLGLDFPVLLDEQTTVTARFNPRRDAPFSLLIDRTGKIVRTRSGYNAGDERSIEADVKRLLGPP